MSNSRIRYLRWRSDEIQYRMNNDSWEASSGYPEEGLSQPIESHNNNYSSENTCCRGSNTWLGLQGRTGKWTSGRVCTKAGTDSVCNTNSNKFLIGINYVAVQSSESYIKSAWRYLYWNRYLTFADSNVFKEENDGCYREVWAQSFHQFGINIGLSDVLESRGYCQQNFDGVFSIA